MKKLLLLLTVCVTLTSCASAGTKSDPDNSAPSPAESSVVSTTDELKSNEEMKTELVQLTNCYKKEDFALPDGARMILTATKLEDGDFMVYMSSMDYNSYSLCRTNADFSSMEPFTYEQPEEIQNYDFVDNSLFFNPDGSACSIVTLEDHGGLVIPEEYDENFDYDSYNDNCTTTYMILTYGKDGKILTKSVFEYPAELYDDYGYISSGMAVADGNSILMPFEDGSIRRISADGEFTTVYELENPEDYTYTQSSNLFRDRDGKIIATVMEEKKSDDLNGYECPERSFSFRELTDEGLSGEVLYSCSESDIFSSMVAGRGDYRFFVPTYDGVVGVKDDGTNDIVIDWLSSSLDCMQIIPCGENDFIGIDFSSDSGAFKLVPRDMSELADVEIITVSDCDIEIVNDFNNSNDEYMVKVVNYDASDSQRLNMDIISGNLPDVVLNLDYSSCLNYCNKGVFTDLYELMDSELSKDMIMPNVLTALENNNKLYCLCPQFTVNTMVAKTKFCDKENWTFNDMLALYDNAPESAEHLYDGESKEEVFRNMFCTMNDLIDYNNATCNFNTPEFIQLLEFCNRFVDTVDEPDKWDDPVVWDNYMADKYHWFGNDKKLTEPLDFYSLCQYNLLKYTLSNGEELSLVGYPSENGKGGRIEPESLMAITEKCENKKGAWEFIKFYILSQNKISEDNYQYQNYQYIPVLTDSFNKALIQEMSTQHSANGVAFPSYTQADVDMLTEYISSCDTVGTVTDSDITSICVEEAGMYFSGEQTAETAAEHIQNRVSILISERK